ncbi:hypothetical protein VNO77_43149 [Canavalia gladiata]|uniref:Uncharacterized protein n=1 Tax=Canavalia gladiata TaxID=3824 RepID=A0AAN9JUA6_CANGL
MVSSFSEKVCHMVKTRWLFDYEFWMKWKSKNSSVLLEMLDKTSIARRVDYSIKMDGMEQHWDVGDGSDSYTLLRRSMERTIGKSQKVMSLGYEDGVALMHDNCFEEGDCSFKLWVVMGIQHLQNWRFKS